MTENNAGLVTRALTKTYMRGNTPVHALAGVDLTLPQGTQVAIMGPSGSGKTTLLHCLAGVLRPSSGSITLDGEEMTTMSERVLSDLRLRRFGFVFQDGQLLPELPTEENIAMPLMLAGTPKSQALSRAREILANLGLDGAGPYRPGQLSGGQAQRVAIGRALATDPSVIFADEPTGALDQATGGEVMSLLTSACATTMSAVRTAAGALLRSRDRATSVLTVAAFALPHAFLLAVTGGVMAFGARAAVAAASATADDPSSLDGMASFYVMLAYFAATLLIVPIISMGAAAARLGMSRRERDLAVLRLVGLAPGKTKLACILETCVFAAVGVVVGSILYAVTLPAWGALSFQGRPMGVSEMWVGVVALLVEGLAMILLAALSSWLAMRKVAITPLGVARRSQAGRVSAVGPILGLVLLVLWLSVGTLAMNLGTAIGMAVFMGFMGAIFLIVNLVGVWSISLMGRIMARVSRSPQMMVAGRRMADDPRAVWRSFGAVALVGFLVGIMYPASDAISMSGDSTDEVARIVIGDINRGMLLTFAITLVLGAVSTAVNQSIRVLDSADQVRALSYMGSPRGFMDRSRRLEVAIPAFVMIVGSMLLGMVFMSPMLAAGAGKGFLIALASAIVGVVLIVVASEATVPLRRRILAGVREGRE